MANDKIEQARQKVEDANQKVMESRPGNVVANVSAFGTPSSYEDPNHPAGKAIAQLDEERTQDLDKYNDDKKSLEKAAEVAADEEVKAAEAAVASAESQADVDEDAVHAQRASLQSGRDDQAEAKRSKSR